MLATTARKMLRLRGRLEIFTLLPKQVFRVYIYVCYDANDTIQLFRPLIFSLECLSLRFINKISAFPFYRQNTSIYSEDENCKAKNFCFVSMI